MLILAMIILPDLACVAVEASPNKHFIYIRASNKILNVNAS